MGISVDYALRETAGNLRRNLLMTFAAILTVAVSLSLVGGALLLRQGVADATLQWRGGVQLSIFMNANATPGQDTAVERQLASMPEVKRFSYVDQQQAYVEFKRMFASSPAFIQAVKASDLPPSYRVVPTKAQLVGAIGQQFNNEPGVQKVVYAKQAVATLLKVTDLLQVIIVSVAIILLLSAAVLILNTIRMAIFARRREVSVMKLVGATNWFIRVPFMAEGMVEGLVGAAVAIGVVVLAEHLLAKSVRANGLQLLNALVVPSHDVVGTAIFILAMGIAVGGIGSALAVRRFLEV
ncbi:MAG: permease-like cell division protein FtsX [Acidimicrobiales bacterium]